MLKTVLLSSMHRVFPQSCPESGINSLSALGNEPVSFQIAFRSEAGKSGICRAFVESDIPVSCYRVGYVPVTHIKAEACDTPLEPGLFPDMLLPYDPNAAVEEYMDPWRTIRPAGREHQIYAADDCWNSMWFTVNEDGKKVSPGVYKIKISFYTCIKTEKVGEETLTLTIFSALLPPQKLMHTSWFHCDSLSDFYRVPVYSERFFEIFYSYAKAAARHGMNMIMLPALTPPLDTPIGHRRMNVQLVKIKKTGKKYEFDFSLMKRYIDIAKKAGIKYFEHAHLFTQWGAACAPAVYAEVGGREKQIFGWDVSSRSEKYLHFLRFYLKAFKQFMSEERLTVLFHISDEPFERDLDFYGAAAKMVRECIGDDCMMGDALSEYVFYEKGFVKVPIVATDHIDDFAGKCDNLWMYYTSAQSGEGFSNRTLLVSPARNRSIGYQLFAYNAKGFLHWGYNYYYDYLSYGLFDPKTDSCGNSGCPGNAFLVYPGNNGEAIVSMRFKVFYEGICDERALRLLEKEKGRNVCDALLAKYFGKVDIRSAVCDPMKILAFRHELNELLNK